MNASELRLRIVSSDYCTLLPSLLVGHIESRWTSSYIYLYGRNARLIRSIMPGAKFVSEKRDFLVRTIMSGGLLAA